MAIRTGKLKTIPRKDLINNLKGALASAKKSGNADLSDRIRNLLSVVSTDSRAGFKQPILMEYQNIKAAVKSSGGSMKGIQQRQQEAFNRQWDKMTPEEQAYYEKKFNIGGFDYIEGESKRALRARERGLKPAFEIARDLRQRGGKFSRISSKDVEKMLGKPEEWHHVGEDMVLVGFYDTDLLYDMEIFEMNIKIEANGHTVTLTTNHSTSKYGQPVVLADGELKDDIYLPYHPIIPDKYKVTVCRGTLSGEVGNRSYQEGTPCDMSTCFVYGPDLQLDDPRFDAEKFVVLTIDSPEGFGTILSIRT